jgi:phospholipid transport system substrate-binding protein
MRAHRRHILSFAAALLAAPAAAFAQAPDPAAAQIDRFHAALIGVMKEAKRLGARGRFEALQPAIERAFDLPTMTRFAVGTTWSTVPSDQQAALVKAFGRMTVANYAHNFDGYGGEKFVLDKVDTRGPDKLVRTRLVGNGAPTELVYRMREAGGAWKVIDVYYNSAVSSLVGQRSEYAATLRNGGAAALVRKLNGRADELLAK